MKRILLCALSLFLLATVGCKKSITPTPEPQSDPSDAMIYLGVAGPATTRVGNEGVRDTVFTTGDQIGVIAAYSTTTNPTTPTNLPDWAKKLYFDNSPACFVKNAPVDYDPVVSFKDNRSYFGWGLAAEGTLANNKYYPSQDKPIMIYAYYPYTASTTSYIKPDGTSTKPLLNVTVNTDVVKLGATNAGANVKQADVLWFASAKEVKRTDTLKTMHFKHALSQLTFRFKRYVGSSPAYVDSIIFCTAKTAQMDLTAGTFAFTLAAADTIAAKYVILPEKTKRAVPIVVEQPDKADETGLLDIFDGVSPLMILPLTEQIARGATLRVVINTSIDGNGTEKDQISMTVPLTKLTMPFEAGKKSVFNILVTQSGIGLEAEIEPWGLDGTSSELETEN